MKRSMIVSAAVLCALLVAVPAALADGTPKVRVIHASPDAPAVDVLVNDEIPAFEGVEFNDVTDYAELPAGVYNFKVVPEGGDPADAVIDADVNLQYYTNYTVLAVDTLENIRPVVFADSSQDLDQVALLNKARVRFFHASPNAPAVDVRVKNGPYLFQNVEFTNPKDENGGGVATDYLFVPATTVDLEVTLAGQDTVVLEVPAVMLDAGTSYTAYATGLVEGEPPLGALLSVDQGAELPLRFRLGNGSAGGAERVPGFFRGQGLGLRR